MGMPRAKLAVASIGSTIQTRPSPVASPPSSSPITRSSGKAAATCSRTMASIAVSAWVTGLRSALIRTRTSPRKTLIPISAARSANPRANASSCSNTTAAYRSAVGGSPGVGRRWHDVAMSQRRVVTWGGFSLERPDLAEAGRGLLYQFGVGLAFLATVRRDGGPRVHPMCPIAHR